MRAATPHSNRPAKRVLHSRVVAVALAVSFAAGGLAAGASPVQAATPYTAYVGNYGAGTVTPINTATNTAGSPITVGANPWGIAITPDGKTAYVANFGSNTVTPINTATNTPGSPITVGKNPTGIAITPDGKTAYVANYGSNTVTPITLATNTPASAITVGSLPWGIAITPDGTRAYVTNSGSNTVTPITLVTNTAGSPITVGTTPVAIAITPDGTKAYALNSGSGTVTPITLATNTAGGPITAGTSPWGIGITPDGKTAYVGNYGVATVIPINTATNIPGTAITVGAGPAGIAITPDDATAYTSNSAGNSLSPVALATNTAGGAIAVGTTPYWVAITPDQAPVASFTVTAGAAGSATSFDASASTVAYGSITSYAWNFGDGGTAATSTPTTAHTYAAAGTYTATLTETDSAGTSTTQVFTGQTMSLNGGLSARTIRTLLVASAPSNRPPAPGHPPAAVLISSRPVTISARGDALIAVSCPVSARDGCRGTITIRLAEPHARRARALAARCARGCRPLGSANYEARAGQTKRIRVHMASFGRKLLARRKALRVTVTATSVSGGYTATFVRTITLRARTRA
jgi:YVTN family beta-propeller protein